MYVCVTGYSVTSINMRNDDDIDKSLRYFAGAPKFDWTGKVQRISSYFRIKPNIELHV